MLFPNVYPGFDIETKITFTNNNENKNISEIIVTLFDTKHNTSYLYKLIQKTPTVVQMLDSYNNILSELELTLDEFKSESIIKIICATLISSFLIKNEEKDEEKCNLYHKLPSKEEGEANPAATNTYTPSQIKTAYSVPEPSPNTNPVITIIIAYNYPNLQADFDLFCKTYNLPQKELIIVSLTTQQESIWNLEECLDVQWAYAMNTNATIQVVEAKSNSFVDLFEAITYANNPPQGSPLKPSDIMSMSWGGNEFNGCTTYDKIFTQNTNICYFAASGDSNPIEYPSSSPNVVSCGGTTLTLNTDNTRESEITWTSAGCGQSQYFTKPLYQQIPNLSQYSNRCANDIAGVANPNTGVNIVYNGKLQSIGGTSVATPLCAGIFSISIGQRKLLGKPTLTTNTTTTEANKLLQNFIYQGQRFCFYDVVKGMDGVFSASNNYDIPTGNGVPNGQNVTYGLEKFF